MLPGVGSVAQPAKHFDVEDLTRLVALSDPQISPDGKSVAIVVQRGEPGTNRWAREIDL